MSTIDSRAPRHIRYNGLQPLQLVMILRRAVAVPLLIPFNDRSVGGLRASEGGARVLSAEAVELACLVIAGRGHGRGIRSGGRRQNRHRDHARGVDVVDNRQTKAISGNMQSSRSPVVEHGKRGIIAGGAPGHDTGVALSQGQGMQEDMWGKGMWEAASRSRQHPPHEAHL